MVKSQSFQEKKRDLLGIMKDKNDMIKAYFTKNRLNLKKMSHLAKIINYYKRRYSLFT